MSSSFDFTEVSTFAAGTEGAAGARVFYLQAVSGERVVSLRLEKQQVALLADYLAHVLATTNLAESMPAHMPDLHEPVLSEWIVGSMAVAIDEAETHIVIIAEEMVLVDDDDDIDIDIDIDIDDIEIEVEIEVAQARFVLTRGQADAFVDGARRVVAGGRPTCPLCGSPQDPDGHFCPRLN